MTVLHWQRLHSRLFLSFSLLVAILSLSACRPAAEQESETIQTHLPVEATRASGELQERLQLSYSYLLDRADKILADMGWGADQYARWIEAVALGGDYLGQKDPKLTAAVHKFLSLQKDDGSILMTEGKRQEWWGTARALVALTNYYEQVEQDPVVLAATRRLADYVIAHAPVPETTDTLVHAHYHSGIEGMVKLWRFTGEKKYLSFAERVAGIVDPKVAVPGPKKLAHQPITSLVRGWEEHQHHTHSYLETIQALVDVYDATQQERFLTVAQGVWEQTVQHTMWASGGIPEVYGEYFEHNDETCPVTSWILLNLKLLRETGDSRYADVVEHSLLNHLFFSQSNRGGFYADRSICQQVRVEPHNKGSIADACCSMHGLRGILATIPYIYTATAGGIDVNLFIPSETQVQLTSLNSLVRLKQETEFPDGDTVRLQVDPERPDIRFELRIRAPIWTSSPAVKLNGQPVTSSTKNGYLILNRAWSPGDLVELTLPFSLAVLRSGENGFNAPRAVKIDPEGGKSFKDCALLHGPLTLMLDPRRNGPVQGEDLQVVLFYERGGSLTLSRPPQHRKGEDTIGTYGAPGRFEVTKSQFGTLVRNRSRANGWQKAILTPMSELTGHPTLTDDPYKVRFEILCVPAERAVEMSSAVPNF